MKEKERRRSAEKASKLGLDRIERSLWMCDDRDEADCASADSMRRSIRHLRRVCKRLRGMGVQVRVFPTRCIDLCRGGPIVAVMPDGIWYGGCTPDVIDRIVDEHLLGGQVVQSNVIAQPRCGSTLTRTANDP